MYIQSHFEKVRNIENDVDTWDQREKENDSVEKASRYSIDRTKNIIIQTKNW